MGVGDSQELNECMCDYFSVFMLNVMLHEIMMYTFVFSKHALVLQYNIDIALLSRFVTWREICRVFDEYVAVNKTFL